PRASTAASRRAGKSAPTPRRTSSKVHGGPVKNGSALVCFFLVCACTRHTGASMSAIPSHIPAECLLAFICLRSPSLLFPALKGPCVLHLHEQRLRLGVVFVRTEHLTNPPLGLGVLAVGREVRRPLQVCRDGDARRRRLSGLTGGLRC